VICHNRSHWLAGPLRDVRRTPNKDVLLRALLVEDEALVAMFAEEVLSSLGFEVEVARSGAEAHEAFARLSPTLAIIDVGLPDVRGDDLAQALRALSPELSILMASGYDAGELRARIAGDARAGVLPKPYVEADMVRAIRGLGFDVESA
jgi:DNA-binding response OmpR family regulator